MKKLNLDDIDHQASFFIYLVNKSRFEVAMTYNVLASAMASSYPLSEVEKKLVADLPSMYSNAMALSAVLEKIDSNFSMISYCGESIEIVGNIMRSLEAIGGAELPQENQTAFLARALTLIGLVFGDIQRVEKVFVGMCERSGIRYDLLMQWTDDEAISLHVEDEIPE